METRKDELKRFVYLRIRFFTFVIWPALRVTWFVQNNLGLVIIVTLLFLAGVFLGSRL